MNKPLRFFHGTHSGNIDSIKNAGLAPQIDPISAMRGNLSSLNGFTENLVFLAPTIQEAAFYAREQAEAADTQPVIFSVLVDNTSALTVSDDYVIRKAIEAMLETANLPNLEFDEDGDVHQYGTSSEAYFFWREVISASYAPLAAGAAYDANLFDDDIGDYPGALLELGQEAIAPKIWSAMSAAIQTAINAPWEKSIEIDRDPAVGFRGVIPADNLKQINKADVTKAIRKIERGIGIRAQYNLDPTNHYDLPTNVGKSPRP